MSIPARFVLSFVSFILSSALPYYMGDPSVIRAGNDYIFL